MVSWQTLVDIAFDEAERQGAMFNGISDGGAFMSDVAEVWQADKDKWRQYTERQARDEISDMIEA